MTLDLPTAWENVSATQQVVPSEDRDFSRPKEPYFSESLSEGVNYADDENKLTSPTPPQPSDVIKQFQTFLSKSQPIIGTVYTGPIDGLPNDALAAASTQVEQYLSKAVGKSAAGLLWNNSTKNFNTSTNDLAEALKLLSAAPPKTAMNKDFRHLFLQNIKKNL